jgi:hypothetical protein
MFGIPVASPGNCPKGVVDMAVIKLGHLDTLKHHSPAFITKALRGRAVIGPNASIKRIFGYAVLRDIT